MTNKDEIASAIGDRYRRAITDTLALLEGLDLARVNPRKSRHFQVIHGLTFHTADLGRGALHLIDAEMLNPAAPLVRSTLEHAVTIQWVVASPERLDDYIHQRKFESLTFKRVAEKSGTTVPAEVSDYYQGLEGMKASPTAKDLRKMFNGLDPQGWLYTQYRLLSAFVHPSTSTTTRYLAEEKEGLALRMNPLPLPSHLLMFTLCLSILTATAPYFDLMRYKPFKSQMGSISDAAELPLWLTQDGKPPRGHW